MPFPPGVETVTLTAGAAGYRALDGEPYQGTIRLTPSVSRVVSAEHGVIALGVENITVGASGEFSKTLLATDAVGFSPSGWTYRVDEEFVNAPGRAYSISLPAAAPTVALPSLSPVESSSGTVASPTVLSVNGETGVVTLDATDVGAVSTGRQVAAGAGLSGGGTLTVDRTLSVVFGATGSTVCVGNDARLSDARTPTVHAASHGAAGTDPVTVAQSQVTGLTTALSGLLPLTGGTLTGTLTIEDGQVVVDSSGTGINAVDRGDTSSFAAYVLRTAGVDRWSWQMVNDSTNDLVLTDSANGVEVLRVVPNPTDPNLKFIGDFLLQGAGKAYRFRRSGSNLDFEGSGVDLIVSNWSGPAFNGSQRAYFRLSADAQNVQVAGKTEFVDGLYGSTKHVLDGAANTVGFFGAAPTGRPTVTGAKGGNAALASLLTALAGLGLIADSTTA